MRKRGHNGLNPWQHKITVLLAFFMLIPFVLKAQEYELPSLRWEQGRLVYRPDSIGNNIPDYSWCGYKSSNENIPTVPVKVVVSPISGDATTDIQKAINYVARLPLNEDGFRGAVLLREGIYEVTGRFTIMASGVIIRGSGDKTVVRAAGSDRATLFRVNGKNDIQQNNSIHIASKYIPVGATEIPVADASVFKVGNQILIERPCTQEWIDDMGMNEFGGETSWLRWRPGERVIRWERRILEIRDNKLLINVPLTNAMDEKYGGGIVSEFEWPGRISNIGIENLTLESAFDPDNPKDENHCWFAITMENVRNAWVRQVKFRHFAGSAVALYETASKITVEDCISLDPVSELAGQRRNTFFTMGQQTLFLRCYAEEGMHDFATGFMAAGPNAFVQCEAFNSNDFSGSIDSWASGTLFDNVSVDGQKLSFTNRGQDGNGAGWAAANSMFWQCSAARIECFAPPGAQNWAYGAWAQFAGNGLWYEANTHINPRSLFFAQLAARQGKKLKEFKNETLLFEGESTSSPTIEQAKLLTAHSTDPPLQLKDFIYKAGERKPISTNAEDAIKASELKTEVVENATKRYPIEVMNGWLVSNTRIIFGSRLNVPWWRGEAQPYEALKAKPAITRYVPGRVGRGYTDDLQAVVDGMAASNVLAINHNYGLWYDRRRDDHERVKRLDGEVWAPFYEQPFSRSGKGEAWDKLSKYDLTKPNPFYWNRLREFAILAVQEGKLLIHQNYFQHNILEAGAHWTDSPWRPANNINNTGFPEPPPYAGDKRIYMAEQFYDVNHSLRRELHRQYIRQCLNNFKGQSNVIQSISAEYTGPLHFMEFWLDVIAEWEEETGNDALVALSCTKDVQDAILADPERSKIIDVIDIRYWNYRPDGSVYAPPGGANLAPRQHARLVNPGRTSFESIYRAVSEYRTKFPGKAVIYSEGRHARFGWAVLMAGGSMPVLPEGTDKEFLEAAVKMMPLESGNKKIFILQGEGDEKIIYTREEEGLSVDMSDNKGEFVARFIEPLTGQVSDRKLEIMGGEKREIKNPGNRDFILWIKKK